MTTLRGPLEGLRVIDNATLFAGPLIATLMGDFGADVIKIEHPLGDPLRNMGAKKDGHGLWWKTAARNKRCIALDLKRSDDAETFKALVADADVLIENFRTGTLESWGLGWEELSRLNPRLCDGEGYRLRPDRAIRPPGRIRHACRGYVRFRPHNRAARRPADATTVRAGGWNCGLLRMFRDDVRRLRPRRARDR